MCARRLPLFLERPETHLYDCNHAHGEAGQSVAGGDEVAPAALPAVLDRALSAQVARARALVANGSCRIPGSAATADDSLAVELEADLSKPCRARLLCSVGKRTQGSATDESDLTGSV